MQGEGLRHCTTRPPGTTWGDGSRNVPGTRKGCPPDPCPHYGGTRMTRALPVGPFMAVRRWILNGLGFFLIIWC